jgi:hypothetical protein
MSESPITAVFQLLDDLDIGGAVARFAPNCTLLMVYGEETTGHEQVRELLTKFAEPLRAMRHHTTAEWHPEPSVWIAELTAEYELHDQGLVGPYLRAVVLRDSPEGIAGLNIYGSHESPLDSRRGYQEVFAAGRWMPTL